MKSCDSDTILAIDRGGVQIPKSILFGFAETETYCQVKQHESYSNNRWKAALTDSGGVWNRRKPSDYEAVPSFLSPMKPGIQGGRAMFIVLSY